MDKYAINYVYRSSPDRIEGKNFTTKKKAIEYMKAMFDNRNTMFSKNSVYNMLELVELKTGKYIETKYSKSLFGAYDYH